MITCMLLSYPGQSHIAYRNSKLTMLLRDSLGGNAKTIMVACMSADYRDNVETLSTLGYAQRCKHIKNRPTANLREEKKAIIQALEDRVMFEQKKNNELLLALSAITALVSDASDRSASLLKPRAGHHTASLSFATPSVKHNNSDNTAKENNIDVNPNVITEPLLKQCLEGSHTLMAAPVVLRAPLSALALNCDGMKPPLSVETSEVSKPQLRDNIDWGELAHSLDFENDDDERAKVHSKSSSEVAACETSGVLATQQHQWVQGVKDQLGQIATKVQASLTRGWLKREII